MDGWSTIWVPDTSVALPNVPHCTSPKAQPTSKRRCGVAGRGGRPEVVLEGALIDGSRVGAGDALGAGPRGLEEGRGLTRRGSQADGRQREPSALGIGSSCGDGTRRLSAHGQTGNAV